MQTPTSTRKEREQGWQKRLEQDLDRIATGERGVATPADETAADIFARIARNNDLRPRWTA